MKGVTREDLVRAEEALQAANTDDTASTDSRSDNGSSIASSDVTDVRRRCPRCSFQPVFTGFSVCVLLK